MKRLANGLLPAMASVAIAMPAWAQNSSAIIQFVESGGNVVASARGTVDTTVLSPFLPGSLYGMTSPGFVIVGAGPYMGYFGLVYDPQATPWPYSSGSFVADSNVGNFFGVGTNDPESCYLGVDPTYLSGGPLSSDSAWYGRTFVSMGLNVGTYRFLYGSNFQNEVVIQVGPTNGVVPEPGQWAAMGILGAGLAGLVVRRRKRGGT